MEQITANFLFYSISNKNLKPLSIVKFHRSKKNRKHCMLQNTSIFYISCEKMFLYLFQNPEHHQIIPLEKFLHARISQHLTSGKADAEESLSEDNFFLYFQYFVNKIALLNFFFSQMGSIILSFNPLKYCLFKKNLEIQDLHVSLIKYHCLCLQSELVLSQREKEPIFILVSKFESFYFIGQ